MQHFIENDTWQQEQAASLMGAFAALALVLASIRIVRRDFIRSSAPYTRNRHPHVPSARAARTCSHWCSSKPLIRSRSAW